MRSRWEWSGDLNDLPGTTLHIYDHSYAVLFLSKTPVTKYTMNTLDHSTVVSSGRHVTGK